MKDKKCGVCKKKNCKNTRSGNAPLCRYICKITNTSLKLKISLQVGFVLQSSNNN